MAKGFSYAKFYYFGVENAIPVKGKTTVVHRCQKLSLDSDEAKNVIEFVTKNYSQGINSQKNEDHIKQKRI